MAEQSIGIALNLALKGLANIDICTSSMKKLALSIKGAGKEARGLIKELKAIKVNNLKLEGIEKQMNGFKSKLLERTATAFSLALPVKLAVDFESAMVDVKKYIDFESEAQFKQMGKEIKALSSQLGVSFEEIANIAASGGQQGLKADQIMDYTRLVTKFGVAFDMSGEAAGDAAAYVMNNFKLSVKELEKLGNQMNFLDDKMSMVKSKDLFNILNRTSSNANILGLNADATAALGASLLSTGKAPEVASTALNSLFNAFANLDGQDAKFHEALTQIGMDADYLKVALKKDAATAVQDFFVAISNVKGDKQMGILTDMFGKQFSDELGTLAVNKDILNKAFSLIKQDSSGSLDQALELKLKTTKSSLERLTSSLKNLGVNIGSVLLPPLASIADKLARFSNFLSELTTKCPFLSKVISYLGVAIMGFAVVLPTVGYALAFVSGGMLRLKNVFLLLKIETALLTIKTNGFTAAIWLKNAAIGVSTALMTTYKIAVSALGFVFGKVGLAIRAVAVAFRIVGIAMMSNPIGLILGGIAIVAGLIVSNWEKVKGWFVSFIEWLSPVWEPVINGIMAAWNALGAFFGSIFEGWKIIFSAVADFMGAVFENPVKYIVKIFEPLFNWLRDQFSWVGSAFDGIKSGIKWLGFGDDEDSSEVNITKGQPSTQISASYAPALGAQTASGAVINVNFSGDFSILGNNNKFDLESFKTQLIQGVKEALRRDEFNRKNTDIRG